MNMSCFCKQHRCVLMLAALISTTSHAQSGTGDLTLAEAESIALASDPGIKAAISGADALDELAVAARQLEDPKLRFGLVSLPVDSFQLGQEPMTQLQLGVQQKFPRGDSRRLEGDRMAKLAQRQLAGAAERRLQLLQRTRHLYLDAVLERRLSGILEQSSALFTELTDITTDYYATGRARQEDVLNAQLEHARISERLAATRQREERNKARLAELVDEAAYRTLDVEWPDLGPLPPGAELKRNIGSHPRIEALYKGIEYAETGESLARQRYKPGFTLDLGYGGRGGRNPDGSSRPDFLSVMLTMDIPLFTSNRQDRVMAARVAETASATYLRDDAWRQMENEIEFHALTLERVTQRLELYEDTLLPQASHYADAAFAAYQDATGDMTSLIRARIAELELRMDYTRLRAELLKTRASLEYFEGEAS